MTTQVQSNQPDSAPPALDVRWLGRMEYRAAWQQQEALAAQRLAGAIGDTLLLLEHPPTLTLGRKAQPEHLLVTPEYLACEKIDMLEVDRGGDITYHGPGQLVGYPILNLREPPHQADLHAYLRALEEMLIRALAVVGIDSDRFAGYTGVWTQTETSTPRKIAAIGVKSSRWITSHGFALNVCPDLKHFDLIVPCGIREYGVTSVAQQLGRELTVATVLPHIVSAFQDVFGYAKAEVSSIA